MYAVGHLKGKSKGNLNKTENKLTQNYTQHNLCLMDQGNSFSYRPFSLGGHVEPQENKKLCFCTASLALNSRLGEASHAKAKLFVCLRHNMASK